jgi:hypothetical protein
MVARTCLGRALSMGRAPAGLVSCAVVRVAAAAQAPEPAAFHSADAAEEAAEALRRAGQVLEATKKLPEGSSEEVSEFLKAFDLQVNLGEQQHGCSAPRGQHLRRAGSLSSVPPPLLPRPERTHGKLSHAGCGGSWPAGSCHSALTATDTAACARAAGPLKEVGMSVVDIAAVALTTVKVGEAVVRRLVRPPVLGIARGGSTSEALH